MVLATPFSQTDCNYLKAIHQFCRDLSCLSQSIHSPNALVDANDFNLQFDCSKGQECTLVTRVPSHPVEPAVVVI